MSEKSSFILIINNLYFILGRKTDILWSIR